MPGLRHHLGAARSVCGEPARVACRRVPRTREPARLKAKARLAYQGSNVPLELASILEGGLRRVCYDINEHARQQVRSLRERLDRLRVEADGAIRKVLPPELVQQYGAALLNEIVRPGFDDQAVWRQTARAILTTIDEHDIQARLAHALGGRAHLRRVGTDIDLSSNLGNVSIEVKFIRRTAADAPHPWVQSHADWSTLLEPIGATRRAWSVVWPAMDVYSLPDIITFPMESRAGEGAARRYRIPWIAPLLPFAQSGTIAAAHGGAQWLLWRDVPHIQPVVLLCAGADGQQVRVLARTIGSPRLRPGTPLQYEPIVWATVFFQVTESELAWLPNHPLVDARAGLLEPGALHPA